MSSKDKPLSLSDADISSERVLSRRSVLGTLGIGAGIAAAAVLGVTSSSVHAADNDSPSRPRICDRDPGSQVDRTCYDVTRPRRRRACDSDPGSQVDRWCYY
jgi:hypothetical protein